MTTSVDLLAATASGVLSAHGGVAHIRSFLHAGMSREHVAHLRHLGVLLRPRIGWYASPELPADAIEAVRVGGVLGCVSAARSWGIVTPHDPTGRIHVSLTRGSTRLRRHDDARVRARAGSDPSVHWHWERRVDPVGGWRTSPLDALLQMASCVPLRWLIAAIDSARNQQQTGALLAPADVDRLSAALPERLRVAVLRSDARAESPGESLIRLGIEDAGIPFDLQVRLTSLYRTDIHVDGWLPVESDGMAFHSGREAVLRDRARDATLARISVPPLRFSQQQAEHDLPFVVDTVRHVWRAGRTAPHGSGVLRRRAERDGR